MNTLLYIGNRIAVVLLPVWYKTVQILPKCLFLRARTNTYLMNCGMYDFFDVLHARNDNVILHHVCIHTCTPVHQGVNQMQNCAKLHFLDHTSLPLTHIDFLLISIASVVEERIIISLPSSRGCLLRCLRTTRMDARCSSFIRSAWKHIISSLPSSRACLLCC